MLKQLAAHSRALGAMVVAHEHFLRYGNCAERGLHLHASLRTQLPGLYYCAMGLRRVGSVTFFVSLFVRTISPQPFAWSSSELNLLRTLDALADMPFHEFEIESLSASLKRDPHGPVGDTGTHVKLLTARRGNASVTC